GELAGAAEQTGVLLDELVAGVAKLGGAALTIELVQERLGGGRLPGAGGAGPEKGEHRLRPGREGGAVRRPRIDGCDALLLQQRGQRQTAKAAEGVAEEGAAGRGERGHVNPRRGRRSG